MKTNNRSVENSRNTRDLNEFYTLAYDTVMWHWSADSLFRQLSTDHNVDVSYHVKSQPNFLTHGAPLHALPLRESSAKNNRYTDGYIKYVMIVLLCHPVISSYLSVWKLVVLTHSTAWRLPE